MTGEAFRPLSLLEKDVAKRRNRKPECIPRFDITLYFSRHTETGDIENNKFKKLFEECDVFLFENPGYSTLHTRMFHEWATQKEIRYEPKVGENEQASFQSSITRILRLSGKTVVLVDLPEAEYAKVKDQITARRENSHIVAYLAHVIDEKMTFAEAVKGFASVLHLHEKIQDIRERYVAEAMPASLSTALRMNPALLAKKDIKVLALLGASHELVHHRIKKGHPSTRRSFRNKQFTFSQGTELRRREYFNKEISEEFVARTLIEKLCEKALHRLGLTSDDGSSHSTRRLLTSLSLTECQCLYESYRDIGVKENVEFLGRRMFELGMLDGEALDARVTQTVQSFKYQ